MSININGVNTAGAANVANTAASNGVSSNQQTSASVDKVEAGGDKAVAYEKTEGQQKYTPDVKTMEKIKADVLAQTESLRNLVSKLIVKQGDTWNSAFDFLVDIDDETKAEAQSLIAEDGYFGVKQTTDRLIGFAKAISGGDPSKIEELRGAVEKGFKGAEKVWGGQLPDICQQTYDSVMAEFDKWAEEAKGSAAAV